MLCQSFDRRANRIFATQKPEIIKKFITASFNVHSFNRLYCEIERKERGNDADNIIRDALRYIRFQCIIVVTVEGVL